MIPEAALRDPDDSRLSHWTLVATAAGRTRLARWLAAGRPVADLSRLHFAGDDFVRDLVAVTIASLPGPVALAAVEEVQWVEVGRFARGWSAATYQAPRGGVIALSGREPDDVLRYVTAHEMGHHFHRARLAEPLPGPHPTQRETHSRLLAVVEDLPDPDGYIASYRHEREGLADACAAAWGYPRPSAP